MYKPYICIAVVPFKTSSGVPLRKGTFTWGTTARRFLNNGCSFSDRSRVKIWHTLFSGPAILSELF